MIVAQRLRRREWQLYSHGAGVCRLLAAAYSAWAEHPGAPEIHDMLWS